MHRQCGFSQTLSYGYNSAGQLSALTTPSGQVITYSYTHGQVTGMAVNGSPLLTSVLYDPFGPTQGWTWGNGTLTVRQYDQDGQLTTLDSAGFSTYTYHPDGAIASRSDDSSASLGLPTGMTTLTAAPTSNRINTTTGTLSRTYSYDATGNITSDGSRTFTYNAAGRMTTALSAGLTTSYQYNALGQRVRKSNANCTTNFVYDEAGHLVGEYDQSGSMIQELVWLNDIPVATIRTDQGGTGAGVFYIHTDHLNAPAKVTRPTDNQVIWRWDHDPFGNGSPNEDPDGNGLTLVMNLRFPGQYWDSETGLAYNYFRDCYDATTGRYCQSDPIGLGGGINTYAYAGGSPMGRIDPQGLAYFAYRALSLLPAKFMLTCSILGTCKVAHEQLFFEDGGNPSNLGYFDDGLVRPDTTVDGYRRADGGYDDCIMREAVAKIPPLPKYNLFCSNCQNWAQLVRVQYAVEALDPAVQEKCGCKSSSPRPITSPAPTRSPIPSADPNSAAAVGSSLLGMVALMLMAL